MQRQGYKAYCPDRSCVRKLPRHGYDPHIFTYREVLRFMESAESYASGPYCGKWSRLIVPLIFRMLYCTGMRAGEVVALEVAEVDLAAKVITVRDAKFGKTRYVPIHDELAGTIREYVSLRKPERYLFPSPREGHYGQHSLYEPFRKILFKAGIPHRGRGFGPRIHDFRHTFAVHSMMKWAMSGHDMATAMPRIAAYLGHKDVSETEWYLHLTIRIAPRLGGMLNSEFGKIFPREFQHDKQ